jgi:hypothetical protein
LLASRLFGVPSLKRLDVLFDFGQPRLVLPVLTTVQDLLPTTERCSPGGGFQLTAEQVQIIGQARETSEHGWVGWSRGVSQARGHSRNLLSQQGYVR